MHQLENTSMKYCSMYDKRTLLTWNK